MGMRAIFRIHLAKYKFFEWNQYHSISTIKLHVLWN